ncbi:acl-9 [Pristionchus pacificus]|nr:acl-9 [Pristionchus pacificus]
MGEPRTLHRGDQSMISRSRGWLLATLLWGSSIMGGIYILFPMVPLLFYSPHSWRRLVDRLVGMWVAMPGAILQFVWGVKVRVVGHKIEHADPALIIMNHRTRLDWLYFWTALYQIDPWLLVSEKITLKGILKYVPGAGWAMGCNAFVFLDRSFESDRTKLDRMIDYYADSGFNYQMLLFPEGTDKCPLATGRSEKHAKEKGLTHYDYVLHARTTGFVHIVQRMRKRGYIKWLYDVTIGFGDAIVQSEVDLITHGLCPKDIQYQIVKIPIDSLPIDDNGLAKWLHEHWEKKEEKLRLFYCREDAERTTFPMPEGGQEFEMSDAAFDGRIFVVSFWTFVFVMWTYFLFTVKYVGWLALIAITFFALAQKVYGGVEWLSIKKAEEYHALYKEDKENTHISVNGTPIKRD